MPPSLSSGFWSDGPGRLRLERRGAMVPDDQRQIYEDITGQLEELVLESGDVEGFLRELAEFSAAFFSARGNEVRCAFTVMRKKKPATVASSDPLGRELDELQLQFGDGPCLSALRRMTTVHVPEVTSEFRWPDYIAAVSRAGVGSILAVPLTLEGESRAAMNLFSQRLHGFSGEGIDSAEEFASQTSRTLRLALRIAHVIDARNDLAAAMQSRTVIDIATGVIMAQNRCSQEAAMRILKSASSLRNIKLRDVAASVVGSVSGNPVLSTHFDE
jgi:putative methionine-R-sulfoxide reductase with GAF domain